MKLLASCSLEKSKTFNGKLELPNENKKSADQVLINIVAGTEESENNIFSNIGSNVFCISFPSNTVRATHCPEKLKGKVFNEYSLQEVENGEVTNVDGIVNLLRLPDDYCDMRRLLEICSANETIRVIGGNLLNIEGVRIGRFEDGKDKMLPAMNGIYDTFVEVDLEDLSGLQEKVKKTRDRVERSSGDKSKSKTSKKKDGGNTSKETKGKSKTKRIDTFNNMFNGLESEDF